MDSQIERISPVECRVRVEIPWNDISPRLDQKLRDVRKRARLPGFRPGKVPPHLIDRMFGKGVREELARDLVQETFQTVVSRHDTTPLTQPLLEESSLEKNQPFTYAARFEVPPQLEPTDYTGVDVRRRPVVVDGEKVDAELERMRQQLTELQPIEGDDMELETAVGDVWTVDVSGALGDTPLERTDVQVEIGVATGEYVPGLAETMSSFKRSDVGATKQVEFVPSAERVRAEYRGQTASVTLGLREIRRKYIPELDDEFARDTGDADSLEELRTKIEDQVREEDQANTEREARRRLVEELLERNKFEPAPSMVAREVGAQVDQTKRQLAEQGLTLAQAGLSEDQMAENIRPQASFNVRAYLLLDAIGKKENVDISDEDLEKELERMAEESGQNLARMRAQMESNQQLIVLRAQMREERILDHLMQQSNVTEAPDPALDDQIEKAAAKATEDAKDDRGSRRKRRKKPEASGAEKSDPRPRADKKKATKKQASEKKASKKKASKKKASKKSSE